MEKRKCGKECGKLLGRIIEIETWKKR